MSCRCASAASRRSKSYRRRPGCRSSRSRRSATSAPLVSLDQQIGEDGDTALGDLLPSDAEAPEETAWDNERERIVHRAIESLPETERTVLTLRFGTGREEPQTLTAIGKRLGFSAERASQLEQRALKKLAESPELAALREAA